MAIEPIFPPTNERGVYVPPSTPEPTPMPDDKAMEYLVPAAVAIVSTVCWWFRRLRGWRRFDTADEAVAWLKED